MAEYMTKILWPFAWFVVVGFLSILLTEFAYAARIDIYTDQQTSNPAQCVVGPGEHESGLAYRTDINAWIVCENGVWLEIATHTIGGATPAEDNIRVEDGDNLGTFTAVVDMDLVDDGDINFTIIGGVPPEDVSGEIRANAVGALELADGSVNTTATLNGTMCGTNEYLVDGGASWSCSPVLVDLTQIEAPPGDDYMMISDSTGASTWRLIPDCDLETQTLNYDQATNTLSCLTDAGGVGSANTVEVELNFGATGEKIASTVVTGQTWVAAGSEIICSPTMLATADRLEGAEDAVIEGLVVAVHTRVVSIGFTVTGAIQGPGLTFGRHLVHCTGA